jgi:aminoethylphosphonate catabolism LysR family transcriptional regulator
MKFAQIRAFHAVAREGSFTGAANRLGLTQPAVTLQVRALEETYGLSLFHRRGRTIEPTDTGRELYALTLRLFEVMDEADDLLSAVAGMRAGRIRLGADGPHYVIGLIAGFREHYPQVRLTVSFGNSDTVRRSLLDYRTDVAVLARDDGDDRFIYLPFGSYPVVLIVGRDHPWAVRDSVALSELHGVPMIRREQGSATRESFETALKKSDVTPDFIMEIGSREAILEAVARNLGISVVVETELGVDARIKPLAIADIEIGTMEFVVCLRERRDSRIVKSFLDVARGLAPR